MDFFPCCEQLHTLCPVPLDFCNRVVDTKKRRTERRHQKLPAVYFHPSARGTAFRGAGARMRAAHTAAVPQ